MPTKRRKEEQSDPLQALVIGFGKLVWWIISLPFRKKGSKNRTGLSTDDRNYIVEKRLEIEKLLHSSSDIELRHAVMEADKLVDYTLKAQRYSGETFADRIKNAGPNISQNLNNDVWSGHKVRNQIAHESDAWVPQHELRAAAEKLLKYTKEGV